jgi:hypothetical protein
LVDLDASVSTRLLDSWAFKVIQIYPGETPSSFERSQRGVWGVDDLVGVYVTRERVEAAVELIDQIYLRTVDTFFWSFTEPCDRSWIDRSGHGNLAGTGWWWERAPIRGEIRDDLERYLR